MSSHDWSGAIERARAHAPFLARSLDRQPDLAELLASGDADAALDWSREQGANDDVAVGLRRHRLALATSVAIGDLAGALPLQRVLSELSSFADHALDTAIKAAIAERTGVESATGMIALALGKQGSGELNYSSDIDPILLYDPDTLPRRESDDPGEVAQRYARRVVKLLSENTGEGYVLRVDLRLRPAAEISPLAVPLASALTHYQGQALAWERAAFVRARAAAGDIKAGEAFLADVAPFVWRQALDFGAIEEIRDLTLRIRQSYDGPRSPGPGFDVKRGRGGIREIEFFAQTHQLIHGGRDSTLRVRGTRAALDALAAAGWIKDENARVLGEGYDRLRVIEHRLQMVNDRQTHSLPDGDALDAVALLDGLANGTALVAELTELTEQTGRIYEGLIGEEPSDSPTPSKPSEKVALLREIGFKEPDKLAKRVEEWRDGRFASIRSPQALEAFDRLLPLLLDAIAKSDDPERALTRWQGILERAPSAITLFRLLVARPALLDRLVAALTLAPTLADELGRKPELLDALLDLEPFDPSGLSKRYEQRMHASALRDDYEGKLDGIRKVTSEERFTLGLRLIEGECEPFKIGAALSHCAEAAIRTAVEAAREEFERAHGQIAGGELVVLGLGRLGGGELTHASDLDIIYLFTGDFAAQSDGSRSLGATLYFNRLASRVTAALSVPTAQGALYEVDTRLRPQGNQGPLAVSVEAFAKYQREQAWTWEHMALTRARVIAASPDARRDIEQIIAEVICQPRDEAELQADVLKMRGEMAKHKAPRGELDAKLLRGGLVDIEFLTHFVQLREAHGILPDDRRALDPHMPSALSGLFELGLLPASLEDAQRLMGNLLIAGRLLAPVGTAPPPAGAKALAQACGRASYAELLSALSVARRTVAQVWRDTFGQELEIDDE